MKKFLFFFCIFFLPYSLLAELPPSVYEESQKNAPEELILIVKDLFYFPVNSKRTDVKVKARVVAVSHSISGLKQDDLITLYYRTFTQRPIGLMGPAPLPLLQQTRCYKAFLKQNKKGDYYLPAAGGRSFELINNIQ
jgi:hypothetical protein